MSGTLTATATIGAVPVRNSNAYDYTVTLTNTSAGLAAASVATFWFAWDDVPDHNFMTVEPTQIGTPANWFAIVTHNSTGTDGYGIQFYTPFAGDQLASGQSLSFTFQSTETPANIGASTPIEPAFSTLSSFVYPQWPPAVTGTTGFNLVVACFCAGTHILTDRGEVPVETLRPGDLVVTVSGGHKALRWIGVGRTLITRRNRDRATPVVIRRHALAEYVPHRDLYITRGHSLYLEGVLIPVEELINHRSIAWADEARVVEYYHLELDGHDVVLAEGAAAETYREDGNSLYFENLATRPAAAPAPPYAPVLHDDPRVRRIWRKLSDRAGRLDLALTDDPDLHLLADGKRLDAEAVDDGVWRFRLAGPVAALRIVSRGVIPSMLGIAQDQRRLGVALRRIVVRQTGAAATLEWDSELFGEGFHAPEPAERHRWTDGAAVVPPSLSAPLLAGATLDLHVVGTLRYTLGPAETDPHARAA